MEIGPTEGKCASTHGHIYIFKTSNVFLINKHFYDFISAFVLLAYAESSLQSRKYVFWLLHFDVSFIFFNKLLLALAKIILEHKWL